MAKYNFMNVPIGANKRFLVQCDGKDFAGFDSKGQAAGYIAMQKGKKKVREPAYAANREWSVIDRG